MINARKKKRKKNQNRQHKKSLNWLLYKIEEKNSSNILYTSKHYGGRNARNAGPAHGRRAGRPFRRKSEQEEVVYGKRILLLDYSF